MIYSLNEIIKMFNQSATKNRHNLEDITLSFPELLSLKQVKHFSIEVHNLDLKISYGKNFKTSICLSTKCDKSKLIVLVSNDNDELKFYVAYNGNNANGLFMIESAELDKVNIRNDNGDVTISNIKIDDVIIKNNNGDTIVDSVILQNANITSCNGDVLLTLINESKLVLKNSNGDIIKNGVQSYDDSKAIVQCVNKNGDIILQNKI